MNPNPISRLKGLSPPPGTGPWIVAGVIAAFAIGGFGITQLVDRGPGAIAGVPSNTSRGCALADVSRSTEDVRGEYVDEFKRFATDIGTHGAGRVCLVVAAGDPLAESNVIWADVGPTAEHRNSPDFAPGEIKQNVDAATEDVEKLLANPPVSKGGSALIEAGLVAGQVLKPGDVLLWLSDGVQNSRAVGNFHRLDLSDAGIQRLLEELEQQGLLADLEGVHVEIPLLLYHPGGMNMSAERQVQIRRFWEAWAERCGAILRAE